MIRAYGRAEMGAKHNGNVLHPTSAIVTEEANGTFELELSLPKNENVSSGDLVLAPTPRGEQYFRIYKPTKTLTGWKVYAFHIFYDLSKNFLVDVRPTSLTCGEALEYVLSHAETSNDYTATSDIESTNTAYYVRINPVQAIMSAENSILSTWGGCLIRDNKKITINSAGNDRGYEIRVGKNLMGIEQDIDESGVVTRLYPTVVLQDNNIVYALPEKYVDSPLLANYGDPIIQEKRIDLTDDQKLMSMDDIYAIMRTYCTNLYNADNVDKPTVNYKIDFVELSKTEEYKDLAILEQLDLYDTVKIYVQDLDVDVSASVIKYTYDCLKERYESIELGDFDYSTKYTASSLVSNITGTVNRNVSSLQTALNAISGNSGGYVVPRRYPDGRAYELLIMDTDDINTAQNVIRANQAGIGFSTSGINGPYNVAIAIGGVIDADFITAGSMSADRITSGILQSLDGRIVINLNDGTINLAGGFVVDDGTTQKITTKRGYSFSNDGLIIDRDGAKTKSVIDETKFEVLNKTGSTNDTLIFVGVDADTGEGVGKMKNLSVSKYLCVGANSRFEDYQGNRTGCFYVGS